MPQPATPTTPLEVPATPTTALPNAATGKANQVLAAGATSPKKRKGGRILIASADFAERASALYLQTQGVAADEVRAAPSPAALRDVLADYSSIDHISILMHMANDELLFDNGDQLTLLQAQRVLEGSVPPIARWSFDGCSIGRGASALYAFAEHFGIARLEGWTHYHHIEFWTKPVWGIPSDAAIAAIHPEVEHAVNFLAKGDAAAIYTSSEIEATLKQGTTVKLVSEVFTYYFEESLLFSQVLTDPRWVDAVSGQPVSQPWTTLRDARDAWYPRVAAREWQVTSQQQATAFEQYFDSNPVLYRVVIMPPAKGP